MGLIGHIGLIPLAFIYRSYIITFIIGHIGLISPIPLAFGISLISPICSIDRKFKIE